MRQDCYGGSEFSRPHRPKPKRGASTRRLRNEWLQPGRSAGRVSDQTAPVVLVEPVYRPPTERSGNSFTPGPWAPTLKSLSMAAAICFVGPERSPETSRTLFAAECVRRTVSLTVLKAAVNVVALSAAP